LATSLGAFGASVNVDKETVQGAGVLTADALREPDHDAWSGFERYIDGLRRDFEFALVLGESRDSQWTRRVCSEADLVLILVDADEEPGSPAQTPRDSSRLQPWEPPRWLIRRHRSNVELPSRTTGWLEAVEPDLHLNVRQDCMEHLDRLARLVAGRAVGLALGGGAARGFGHFGTVLALQDAGLPVDYISGTSAGALAAVLVAQEGDVLQRARVGADRLTEDGNPFGDLTLPAVSLLRSTRIRSALRRVFGQLLIEDLWIPVRIVATSLAKGRLVSFERGEAWRLTLASGSPPGLTVPVPIDGSLHCDGGILDNLPMSVLPDVCGVKVASSVSHEVGVDFRSDRFPSSWGMIKARIARTDSAMDPNIFETLFSAMAVAGSESVRSAEREADLFFDLDLSQFGIVDFAHHGDMVKTAYDQARETLRYAERVASVVERVRGVEKASRA
jgi:NTE family protein